MVNLAAWNLAWISEGDGLAGWEEAADGGQALVIQALGG